MPASIGVNLRVTGHCSQGGRKYMEDLFSVAYQQTEDERDLEYAFFGIYDGHGGSEAAAFAKEHLMDSIVKQRQFWSDNDEDVLKAIRNGYMLTHLNMWKELEKWPKTVTGLPSTAGTTASVAFIRRGKIYVGHVGDSAIVLGYQKDDSEEWAAKPLTCDHKPESTAEIERIQKCGGKVISKAGVPRVVWNRPRIGHKGPIKKNTPMDEIPFLAVARSLGDLWSYNPLNDEFIVSPDPDVGVLTIDPAKFRCLIFGTDGLWNMISPEGAVSLVQATERHNEAALVGGNGAQPRDWLNPSKSLVDHALERWSNTRMRADNTSVVTLMLDPPGPPRATVLRSRCGARAPAPPAPAAPAVPAATHAQPEPRPAHPQNGLTIMTRYTDAAPAEPAPAPPPPPVPVPAPVPPVELPPDADALTNYGDPSESSFMSRLLNRTRVVNTLAAVLSELAGDTPSPPRVEPTPRDSLPPATELVEPRAETPPREPTPPVAPPPPPPLPDETGIQINEVSSSSPVEAPARGRPRRNRLDPPPGPPAGRVLRSHHEPEPPRPATRAASRARGPPTLLAATTPAPTDRVVILARRAPPAAPAPAPASVPTPTPDAPRATRSTAVAPATPLAQKITRGLGACARELRGAAAAAVGGARAGNSARAPGPARRAPAARRQPACRSKENRGGRARAGPAPRPALRAASAALVPEEVHSTTAEVHSSSTRALRSRNDAAPPPPPPAAVKRPRGEETPTSAGKTPRLAPTLGKRASGPWAPALALRNRLRRRLAK